MRATPLSGEGSTADAAIRFCARQVAALPATPDVNGKVGGTRQPHCLPGRDGEAVLFHATGPTAFAYHYATVEEYTDRGGSPALTDSPA